MNISDLKHFELIYVGTPYTKYPGGIELAFADACKLTARLIGEGLNVYSPIVHCHAVAIHGGIDPLDHKFWLSVDAAMMHKADAMIVAMMDTWEDSTGIKHEVDAFCLANKPWFYLNPADLSVSLVP